MGRNSPYTKHLLQHLPTPQTDVEKIMRRVGAAVEAETNQRQVPYINSAIRLEDAFLSSGVAADGTPFAALSAPSTAAQPSAATTRKALVVACGAYKRSPLRNTPNDGRDMHALLQRMGYQSTLVMDPPDLSTFSRAVFEFHDRLSPGDVALFYLSLIHI